MRVARGPCPTAKSARLNIQDWQHLHVELKMAWTTTVHVRVCLVADGHVRGRFYRDGGHTKQQGENSHSAISLLDKRQCADDMVLV